ncbi:MBL fold metallo-hydrolase [uncultured Jatrophihabitans sp.]|uniref:MBL fold metallo-hydrolase n=1 Tax=uncultured Jatrophihabitans sp. TaxID=1610747 RepID=UPI0035C9E43B
MVERVADGVFVGHGTDVNWILVVDGKDVTLVDTGYPGDRDALMASIRAVGRRPEDVRAVLLTHAHIDHVGSAAFFADTYGTPVYTDPVEVGHARHDHREQAGPLDVARNAWRPGVLPWTLRIMRVGALSDVPVQQAAAFPRAGALDLPGRPTPVATHGHTSGHTAYLLPDAGAIVTGDGLITGHSVSRTTGPQLIAPWFNHGDPEPALLPLADLDADLLLPGHGDPWRGSIGDAVAQARARR